MGGGAPRHLLRRSATIAVAIAVVVCAAGAFQRGLWSPDEPREAEIGREMLLSRWSAVPTLGGEPFLEKPPLFAWTMAAGYAVFGVSAAAARVPAFLFGVGAVVVAYLLGRRCGGRLAGLLAAAVLLTCNEFASTSRRALIDTALTFFVACGHLALLRARDDVSFGRRTYAFAAAGLAAALAFLTKGPVGPALIAGPPLVAAAIGAEWTFVRRATIRLAAWSALFLALVAGPWILALQRAAGWDAVSECLVRNTFGRVLGGATKDVGFVVHDNPPWYYLKVLPDALLPWTLAIPALVLGGTLARRFRGAAARHLALVVLAGVAMLSVPAGKRSLYLVPLLPAAAAVFGTWLSRVGSRRGSRWDRATLVATLVLLAAAAAYFAYLFVGAPLPRGKTAARYADLLAAHGATLRAVGAGCGVAALVLVAAAIVGRRLVAQRLAAVAAVATCVCVFGWHAFATSVFDFDEDLGPGAREIASLVPPGEPLLALAPDETTRAVLPFFTGRTLERVPGPAAAMTRLAAGPARHLVVMDSSERAVTADLRANLRLVRTVRLNWDRGVSVYAWAGP